MQLKFDHAIELTKISAWLQTTLTIRPPTGAQISKRTDAQSPARESLSLWGPKAKNRRTALPVFCQFTNRAASPSPQWFAAYCSSRNRSPWNLAIRRSSRCIKTPPQPERRRPRESASPTLRPSSSGSASAQRFSDSNLLGVATRLFPQ